jgi:hypothetical protein
VQPLKNFPAFYRTPKVQYRVQKNPPLVHILSHINSIHTIPSYLSKIHLNIVHPPTSSSFQWSLCFWFSHQYPICIPHFPYSCYIPAHLIVQTTKYYSRLRDSMVSVSTVMPLWIHVGRDFLEWLSTMHFSKRTILNEFLFVFY